MIRTFFNEKAAIWDETVAEKDVTKLECMAERLKIEPGSSVLDVGTGTGVFVPQLLRKIGKYGRLVTLDVAEEMLKRAQTKGFNGNIDYLHADIASIPLGEEIFDVVVCYSTFPHFQDKLKSLSEIYRVLKRGGKLYICHTSSRRTINNIHRQLTVVQNDTIPGEGEMRVMLSAAGFTDTDIFDNPDNYLARATKPNAT